MSAVQHLNTVAGAKPYKNLFSTVSIIPPNTSVAYISTQWACDPETGELVEGVAGDYGAQAKIVWENVVGILKELGAELKDVVQKTACFLEFNDDVAKAAVEAQMSVTPDEWKADVFSSSIIYRGVAHFHRPGVVYGTELIVALPNRK